MSEQIRTVVLVLKNGKGFGFRDVELIVRHINGTWKSETKPRIICFWDKATTHYDLGNFEIRPLRNDWPGVWSRMILYSPEVEDLRPFLYVDLDTAIVDSLENIFDLVKDPSMFITLEDFYQKGKLATGLVWFPANSSRLKAVWDQWKLTQTKKGRMDYFLRNVITPDIFWQNLTDTIHDFKPSRGRPRLTVLPKGTNLVCFHGKPRIYNATEVPWIEAYTKADFSPTVKKKVTVIIPYKTDRGWLKDAIASVPDDVQLLVSQGEGNWPQNFNKVLNQAEGEYIKYLHEDDMLSENCIRDSVQAMEEQGADFIHGQALEMYQGTKKKVLKTPKIELPTLADLINKNVMHSVTLMYRKSVFRKIGSFDESLTMCEEYEFNLRCLRNRMKIGYSPNVLGIYRRHPTQKIRMAPEAYHKKEKEMVQSKYV